MRNHWPPTEDEMSNAPRAITSSEDLVAKLGRSRARLVVAWLDWIVGHPPPGAGIQASDAADAADELREVIAAAPAAGDHEEDE